jgi:glycosyltransferase involved in cell wall biosynthesis
MKILHVIPGLTAERGGPSAVVQALVRHQVDAGHAVVVLTTDQGARHGEHPIALHPAAELVQLPVCGPDRLAYAPGFASAARNCLSNCNVAHVHSIFTYPIHAALRAALAEAVPVVLRPCGLLHRYSLARSRWQKRAYLTLWGRTVRRACAAWHYTSTQEAAESWPADATPRFILPNGIETESFDIDRHSALHSVWQTYPTLHGSPYVLFLGRLHPKKRLDLLVEAFLGGAPPAFKLVVAGPDECRLWPRLAAKLLEGPGAQRVLRIGLVTGAGKAALLAGATLFALPSEHENFGIAALEALASGTPVLLSPGVDLAPEAAAAGWGNIAPIDLSAWRAQLAEILAREPLSAEEVRQMKSWVAAHYSWQHIARTLEEHYESLTSCCGGMFLTCPAAPKSAR